MKKLLLVLVMIAGLTSCTKTEEVEVIVYQEKIVEILVQDQTRINQLQTQINELEGDNSALQTQLSSLQVALDAAYTQEDIDYLNREIARLEHLYTVADAELKHDFYTEYLDGIMGIDFSVSRFQRGTFQYKLTIKEGNDVVGIIEVSSLPYTLRPLRFRFTKQDQYGPTSTKLDVVLSLKRKELTELEGGIEVRRYAAMVKELINN